jgi:hypothetical protein
MALISKIVTWAGAMRERYNVPRLLIIFGSLVIIGAILLVVTNRGIPESRASSSGETTTKLITINTPIPFETITITSSDLPENATEIKVAGRDGVAAETYQVKFVGAVGKTKKLIRRDVTAPPVSQVVVTGKRAGANAVSTPGGGGGSSSVDTPDDDPATSTEPEEVLTPDDFLPQEGEEEEIDCAKEPEFCE